MCGFFGGGVQSKAPKEIHIILAETLACFLPGRAKGLLAPLYSLHFKCHDIPTFHDIISEHHHKDSTHYVTSHSVGFTLVFLNFRSKPIPVAARSKAWVYGRSPAGIVGSNPTGGMDVCLL